MNCVLIIERNGYQNAVKLSIEDEKSISVGRSWQSDVVVSDQYVDSEHLKISANDDQFSIEDLGSANGTKLKRKAINSATHYEMGTEILLGETTLRLIDEKSSVAPTVKYQGIDRLLRHVGVGKLFFISTALMCLSFVALQFWGQSDEVTTASFSNAALRPLSVVGGYTFYAGCIGLLCRKKPNFMVHWSIACALFAFMTVLTMLADIVSFNLNSPTIDSVVKHGSFFIGAGLFLYFSLSISSKLKAVKKCLWIFTGFSIYLAFEILVPMSKPDHEKWSSRSTISHKGQIPELLFAKTHSLDEHLESSESLFIKLDRQLK